MMRGERKGMMGRRESFRAKYSMHLFLRFQEGGPKIPNDFGTKKEEN